MAMVMSLGVAPAVPGLGASAAEAAFTPVTTPSTLMAPSALTRSDLAGKRLALIQEAAEDARILLRTARHQERVASSRVSEAEYEHDQLVEWFGESLTREAVAIRNTFPEQEVQIAELKKVVERRQQVVDEVDRTFDALHSLHAAAATAYLGQLRLLSAPGFAPGESAGTRLAYAARISRSPLTSVSREVSALADPEPPITAATIRGWSFRLFTLDQDLVERLQGDDRDTGTAGDTGEAGDAGESAGTRGEATDSSDDESQRSEPMVWPGIGAVNSGFGWRIHPVWGGRRMHEGIDIDAAYGDAVVATADGEVTVAGWNGGYGLMVKIDHGDGVETRYGHMQTLDVAVGDTVSRGDTLGTVGATGTATDAHIHFEVRVDGEPVDPLNFLP